MEVKGEPGLEILQFNYKNLHESFWSAHNFGWVITGIFVPVLFSGLGFFVKEYGTLSTFQVVMGAVAVEFFALIWWLAMRMLERYNEVRLNRLRQIEESVESQLEKTPASEMPLLRQYRLGYNTYARKLQFSPGQIYLIILAGFTIINVALVCVKVAAPGLAAPG